MPIQMKAIERTDRRYVGVRLHRDIYAKVVTHATKEGRAVSQMIEQLVLQALKERARA